MPREVPDIRVGDRVRMRRPHPCGGDEWTVTRVGADIGMRCATCGRRVMLDRLVYERRLKLVVTPGPPAEEPVDGTAAPDGVPSQDGSNAPAP